jgi:HK97 family phage major capsid protein
MPTNLPTGPRPERLDILLQKRTRAIDATRAIIEKAEERGELIARERRELNKLEVEIKSLEADIRSQDVDPETPDTFARAARIRTADAVGDGEAVGLKRGESMQAWAEQRSGIGSYGVSGDGLEDEDISSLSLGSIVRSMVTGRRDGLSDVEKRALSEGTDSAGGYLTPEILAARLIDRVRNTGRIFQAGATVIPLESDKTAIARLVSGVSPTFKAEGADIDVSDMTFDRVTLQPKTIPVLVKLSQELFDDLSSESHALIEGEIAKAIGLAVDEAALYGDGSGANPLGIKGRSSEGVVLTAFGGSNGGTPSSYDFILDGLQTLAGANFTADGIMLAPRTNRTLAGLKDTTGRYLDAPASVKEVPFYSTNQIPTTLTVGTSTGVCSDVVVGAWSNLLVGVRPSLQLRVKVLDQRFADSLSVGIVAWMRVDFALAHGAAFNVISGVKP